MQLGLLLLILSGVGSQAAAPYPCNNNNNDNNNIHVLPEYLLAWSTAVLGLRTSEQTRLEATYSLGYTNSTLCRQDMFTRCYWCAAVQTDHQDRLVIDTYDD